MSAEIAVLERLVDQGAVTSLVSTRIYQLVLPQGSEMPAIRVQLIDDPQTKHLRGPHGTTAARVQVDFYDNEAAGGDPYEAVSAGAEAVNDALVNEPFFAGSVRVQNVMRVDRRALYDPEERDAVRMQQDFIVWSKQM